MSGSAAAPCPRMAIHVMASYVAHTMEDSMDLAEMIPLQPPAIAPHVTANLVPLDADADAIAAARSDRCILLTGAPLGASALALRIHNLSGWRWGPFVAVDC